MSSAARAGPLCFITEYLQLWTVNNQIRSDKRRVWITPDTSHHVTCSNIRYQAGNIKIVDPNQNSSNLNRRHESCEFNLNIECKLLRDRMRRATAASTSFLTQCLVNILKILNKHKHTLDQDKNHRASGIFFTSLAMWKV